MVSFYRGLIGLLFAGSWLAAGWQRVDGAVDWRIAESLAVLSAPSWPLFAVLGIIGAGVSFIVYIVGLRHSTPAGVSV